MNIPSPADLLAAFLGARPEPEAEAGEVRYGPCDRIAEPEPEAEP